MKLFAAVAFGCTLLTGISAQAQNVWTISRGAKASAATTQRLCGKAGCRHQVLQLDRDALDALLRGAPREGAAINSDGVNRAGGKGAGIKIPMPDGSFEEYSLLETEVLGAELAAKYPDIHSYLGKSATDPSSILRLDVSKLGASAILLKGKRVILIDPDGASQIVYEPVEGTAVRCNIGELKSNKGGVNLADAVKPDLTLPVPLAQLRVYRTALMLTSTYVEAADGTAAGAVAMATSNLNRVNAIYERDLNVRLKLVDTVVFVNAATQPFTVEDEANSIKVLEASQSILMQQVGADKFDVGEGFTGVGGGGVAAFTSVCNNDNKAQGSSLGVASVSPIHWLNLVAHEFGHQFGASHTFNAMDVAGCKASSRNQQTALEPGSGSTTMSYVGLCNSEASTQDLQPSEDLIFHSYNIKEMLDFVNDGAKATASCSIAPAGPKKNSAPIVKVGGADFFVPVRTAFYLDAQATDPDPEDADKLTFSWEQLDVGAASPGNEDEGTRPLFRAYMPVNHGRRYFPSLPWVLAGIDKLPELYDAKTNTGGEGASESKKFRLGEVVPTTDRTMRFRVTVRDNRPSDGVAAGSVGFGDSNVRVVATAGPFRVTSPKGGESWDAGSMQTITWDVANTTVAPLSTATVTIMLSADGGQSFNIIARGVPNDGKAAVTLPGDFRADKARIKIEAGNSVYFAVADGDVQIK